MFGDLVEGQGECVAVGTGKGSDFAIFALLSSSTRFSVTNGDLGKDAAARGNFSNGVSAAARLRANSSAKSSSASDSCLRGSLR